jgi:hypothetical protein
MSRPVSTRAADCGARFGEALQNEAGDKRTQNSGDAMKPLVDRTIVIVSSVPPEKRSRAVLMIKVLH